MQRHGTGFLDHYRGSLQKALQELFPQYQWKPWLFSAVGGNFWSDQNNASVFLDWLKQKICIVHDEEWYELSSKHLVHFGGRPLLGYWNNHGFREFAKQLARKYPDVQWNHNNFLISLSSKTQHLLFRIVRSLLPSGTHIEFNSTSLDFPEGDAVDHPAQTLDARNVKHFDVYVPAYDLALEYHGVHHYRKTKFFGSANKQQANDECKRELCLRAGVTLIEVGYWWDLEKSTIAATLQEHRPDIQVRIGGCRFALTKVSLKLCSARICLKRTART